jgi:hypothetical protein
MLCSAAATPANELAKKSQTLRRKLAGLCERDRAFALGQLCTKVLPAQEIDPLTVSNDFCPVGAEKHFHVSNPLHLASEG